MITVVSTASKEGFKVYGCRFIDSFADHWPGADRVRLLFYTEGYRLDVDGVETHDLSESTWLADFKQRYRREPRANGHGGYQWDAIRFAHKVAAIIAADLICDDDHLLWLDADIITHNLVDEEAIKSWLPVDGAWLSWLERNSKIIGYPECGFLLFNRCHQRHVETMERITNLYSTGQIFDLAETHDSYVWQHVVNELRLPTCDLSGEGYRTMHPLINGPLGHWFDHLKGSRKLRGRSHQSDLITPRPEAYWKT